jgi:hypothetical protein
VLQHEAFDAALARLCAQRGIGRPVAGVHERRQRDAAVLQARFQSRAALMLRQRAQIDALVFEQVISDEAHRRVGEQLFAEHLAVQALLQQRERGRLFGALLPDEQLTVEHGAVGQRCQRRQRIGKSFTDQFLAARPQPHAAGALDCLCADAVVLPFDHPIAARAE